MTYVTMHKSNIHNTHITLQPAHSLEVWKAPGHQWVTFSTSLVVLFPATDPITMLMPSSCSYHLPVHCVLPIYTLLLSDFLRELQNVFLSMHLT